MDPAGKPLVPQDLRRLVAPPERQELTDRQLLDVFVAQRDEAAFTVLVQRHGPMVLGVARRLLRDTHAAEDVFQATFLILAYKAHTIRQRESVNSWLYGVAHRLALRVRLTSKRWETDARGGTHMAQEHPEAILTQRELETVLDEELKELSDQYRAPLLLCYLEEQTQDEAARQLGWSKATLRRRLERGRALLRTRLLRRGVTLSLGLLTTTLAVRAEAAVLSPLVHKTALASVQATMGMANAVPPHVAALAEWGMKSLSLTRKFVWLWVLAAVLAAGGGGLAAHALSGTHPAPVPAANPATEKYPPLGSVWGVAYAPDGLTLASGSGSASSPGTLALWDVPTGKVRLWLDHPQGVRGAAFSPDGAKVATACWDNKVRVYDARTGRVHVILKGHDAAVNSVAFSPDGKTLASGSLDTTIILWDVERGGEVGRLLGHKDWVLAVAIFRDGKSLASASKDGTVRVWTLETRQPRQVMKQTGAPLESLAVSPDGKTIATGDWDHAVRLWDVGTGTQRAVLRGHTMGVLSLSFSPDGTRLVSVSGNFNRRSGGEIKLWSMPDGEEQVTWQGHTNGIWAVRFAPDGRTLATGSHDQTVKIWDAATGQERLTLKTGDEDLQSRDR